MAKQRPGVMLYFDIEPGLKILDDTQRGQLFSAILEYAHWGAVPSFDEPLLSMAWSFVKTSIDRDGERYEKTVAKKKISGITSDFKRNYAPKHGIDPEDEQALAEYIRQKMSTDVDECESTTSQRTTPNTDISPATNPPETPATRGNTNVAGKGSGENPNDLSFEELREQKLKMLIGVK